MFSQLFYFARIIDFLHEIDSFVILLLSLFRRQNDRINYFFYFSKTKQIAHAHHNL